MADELAKKKRIRGGHKASTTKIMQQMYEHTTSPTPDEAKLEQELTDKFSTIKILDDEICGLIGDESVTEDIDAADQFKATIYDSLLSIDRFMEKLRVSEPVVSASKTATNTCQAS